MKCLGCGHETETPWQCICGWRRMPTQEDVETLQRMLLGKREEWRRERAAIVERERLWQESKRIHQEVERRHRIAEKWRSEWRWRNDPEWRRQEAERIQAERNRREAERIEALVKKEAFRQEALRLVRAKEAARDREIARLRKEAAREAEHSSREAQEADARWRKEQAERERIRQEWLRAERLRREERRARRAAAKAKPKPPDVYAAEPISPLLQWRSYRRAVSARNLDSEVRFFDQRNEAAHQYFLRLADQVAESLPEREGGGIWWD